MQQEVILALLAKEPSHGYELRGRLDDALGPLAEGLNAGQIYVTLSRLEKSGLVVREVSSEDPVRRPRDQKVVYALTPAGQDRLAAWLSSVEWARMDLAEFHLKLVAAGQGRLADPLAVIDAQRRELLRRLRDVQRAALAESSGSDAGVLLEGMVLRLQADLRWLETCERSWTDRGRKR